MISNGMAPSTPINEIKARYIIVGPTCSGKTEFAKMLNAFSSFLYGRELSCFSLDTSVYHNNVHGSWTSSQLASIVRCNLFIETTDLSVFEKLGNWDEYNWTILYADPNVNSYRLKLHARQCDLLERIRLLKMAKPRNESAELEIENELSLLTSLIIDYSRLNSKSSTDLSDALRDYSDEVCDHLRATYLPFRASSRKIDFVLIRFNQFDELWHTYGSILLLNDSLDSMFYTRDYEALRRAAKLNMFGYVPGGELGYNHPIWDEGFTAYQLSIKKDPWYFARFFQVLNLDAGFIENSELANYNDLFSSVSDKKTLLNRAWYHWELNHPATGNPVADYGMSDYQFLAEMSAHLSSYSASQGKEDYDE